MKKAQYILLEGSEGTGKSTQCKILVDYLRSKGFKVLETKEPGTIHSPITLELRKLMLDSAYEKNISKLLFELKKMSLSSELTSVAKDFLEKALDEVKQYKSLTLPAREYISQSIRSIHINNVIYPAFNEYDFIIQDRGIFSGLAYGVACGNSFEFVESLSTQALNHQSNIHELYDLILLFEGNVSKGLSRALQAKKEFENGDAMENKGLSFLEQVNLNFKNYKKIFKNVKTLSVDNKSIEEISSEIKNILKV